MRRVILVDDHVLVRAGIRSLLQSIDGVEVVAEANNGREALALVEKHQPDMVLMDIGMSEMNGLEATSAIKQRFPTVQIIILSMYINEAYVEQALRAGASGYLLKDAETVEVERTLTAVESGKIYLCPRVSKQLVESYLKRSPTEAIESAETQAPSSECPLTVRQREILRGVAEGFTTKQIAQRLGISPKTVEAHRALLMERLDIHDIPGLVRYAIRSGLVALDG
jgi:DNA-binding NarL/FixJ family response regulator